MWWVATAFAGQGFLAEELGMPSAAMPPGTTEVAECVVAATLAPLTTPDAPPSAAYDPNAAATEYTVEIPDAYRAGAPKVVATGIHATAVRVTGCAEPYAGAAKALIDASAIRESAQRQFEGGEFDVRVVFAPPSLVRTFVTPPPPSLAAATLVAEAPEKTFDKPPFRPREVKPGRCDVIVYIDAAGDPYAADLAACRADMYLFLKSAVLAWKYAPVLVDGVAVPAKFQTALAVK